MSSLDYLELCRLCLVKDRVSVPIFEGEGDVRQIFLKIAACLPVKVAREDKLPKKICDDCVYKVELFYQFWNTTANAEKQLVQWLGESGMKGEGCVENRLDRNVMQVGEHQNNMGMGMMDNMSLGIPMIISNTNQQQITSVPMDTSTDSVQTIQAVPGPSSQTTHNQISRNQTSSGQQEDEEEDSEEEENTDDECDGEDGLPVKEESEEDPSNRTIEPTTFVNVSLACDEAGPSGLQQQKISDIPEMPIPQPADNDPKSGAHWILDRDLKTEDNLDIEVLRSESQESAMISNSLSDVKFATTSPTVPSTKKQTRKRRCQEPIERICIICNLNFNNQNDYRRHMVKHSDLRPHKCLVCDKAFKRSSELCLHRQIHRGIQHSCEYCDFTTTNRLSLKLHRRRIHHRDFPFRCDKCMKGFMSNYDLQDHTAIHEGKKSHVCETCGNAYFRKASLRMHRLKVHGINGDSRPKLFQCGICSKSFVTEYSLRNHIASHSQRFLCAACGMEFSTSRSLKLHSRKHTGERPYQCEVCLKAFITSRTLKVHKLIHTGQRPYVCDLCGQTFTQRSSMMTHRRKHPGVHSPPPPMFLNKLESNECASQPKQVEKNTVIVKEEVLDENA